MAEFSTENEALWRLGCFLLVFIMMSLWELQSPRRQQSISKFFRWSNNLSLIILDSLLVRIMFPVLAVSMAIIAQQNSFGLFNLIEFPISLEFILSLLVLDLSLYLQHVAFHYVPLFWRFHRMHHADLELDVSSGVRFHPLEIIVSMIIKLAVVFLLGPSALVVLVFEILLNSTALFNHSNVYIPLKLDKMLKWFLVTPDMHRIHHSILPKETNSNFGFNLPWWDKLFGTYQDQPSEGHKHMTIGLKYFRRKKDLRLDQMLLQPLKNLNDSNKQNLSN